MGIAFFATNPQQCRSVCVNPLDGLIYNIIIIAELELANLKTFSDFLIGISRDNNKWRWGPAIRTPGM